MSTHNFSRDTAAPLMFWKFDGLLALLLPPMPLLSSFWQYWAVLIFSLVFFTIIRRRGYTVKVVYRMFLLKLAGGGSLGRPKTLNDKIFR